MIKNNYNSINMVSETRVQALLDTLKEAYPQVLMIKELAQRAETSPNTAGKYVDILEARGLVTIRPYATAKQVVLKEHDEATKGGGKP
jgi:Mn-dependent DtxR family transcriptional regulator